MSTGIRWSGSFRRTPCSEKIALSLSTCLWQTLRFGEDAGDKHDRLTRAKPLYAASLLSRKCSCAASLWSLRWLYACMLVWVINMSCSESKLVINLPWARLSHLSTIMDKVQQSMSPRLVGSRKAGLLRLATPGQTYKPEKLELLSKLRTQYGQDWHKIKNEYNKIFENKRTIRSLRARNCSKP